MLETTRANVLHSGRNPILDPGDAKLGRTDDYTIALEIDWIRYTLWDERTADGYIFTENGIVSLP